MVDFHVFIIKLGSSLQCIPSHCISLQEVNSMSDLNFKDLMTRNELLSTQPKESSMKIANLEEELLTLKCSKNLIEDQIENDVSIVEELGTQLTVVNSELNALSKKISSLDVEFEVKSSYCDELEANSLELQLQLQRYIVFCYSINLYYEQCITISTCGFASGHYAECFETFLHYSQLTTADTSKFAWWLVTDCGSREQKHVS